MSTRSAPGAELATSPAVVASDATPSTAAAPSTAPSAAPSTAPSAAAASSTAPSAAAASSTAPSAPAASDAAPSAPAADDTLALENQVCFALAIAARNVIALYRPLLEPLGLTHPQYLVMLALWQQSPRSVKNLACTLSLEPATLSPLLKRLEGAGLVSRTRNPADDRMLDITLTPTGTALRSQAETIPPRVAAALSVPLPELEHLRAALHSLIAASA